MPAEPRAPRRRVIRFPAGDDSAGRLGLALLLVSLGVLFAAAIVAYLAVRLSAAPETRALAPELPAGLWLGTALLAAGSVTVQGALAAARRGLLDRLRWLLTLTTLLSTAFLAVQGASWLVMLRAERSVAPALGGLAGVYLAQVYFLTGVHAAHVIGGLVFLLVVTRSARRGRYSPAQYSGVRNAALYWHFLGVAWLALFATLLATH